MEASSLGMPQKEEFENMGGKTPRIMESLGDTIENQA
jgi:hypothetical protein